VTAPSEIEYGTGSDLGIEQPKPSGRLQTTLDGYLYLVDRKKEMILVGGYNVYPREIDEVLSGHPAVMEAAVVGIPDEFRGEAVKACVALNPGARASAEELLDHCRERLVKYKLPTVFEFHHELPRTGPGKIDKLRLKGER
jgi:long-chain acyl-CoA synthetase